jgi:peroxiredoxin
VLFVFAANHQGSDELAELIQKVRPAAERGNVAFLGVSRDAQPERARRFSERHGIDFPILDDPQGRLAARLPLEASKAAVLVADAQGYLVFGFSGTDPRMGSDTYESALREALRLPARGSSASLALGLRPEAPLFTVTDLEGGALSLAALERQVAVLVFFLHTCPHCHEALRFLDRFARELARDDLRVVAVSVQPDKPAVAAMGKELGIALPLYLDPERRAQIAYAHSGNVPEIFVIDRERRVTARHRGMSPRTEALMRMEVRQALGVENPILLEKHGYSGAEFCLVCHPTQHETWSLTNHAYAFDTLVEHAADRNPECLPCHTVGFGEEGGYTEARPAAWLEGVQCENCHGRGGPHQSPDFLAGGFEPICVGCHDAKHSLRFQFGDRLPLVSHAVNRQFASLSLEEREKLLERRDKRDRQLFEKARFVGSESCRSCHAGEHERWANSAHARAFDTLEQRAEAQNADCQRCHTTGFGEEGGFPEGGDGLRQVGCESCHGPGGEHVGENARRSGTILTLRDKCDSCVILQICGSCHDDANDPNFEFELQDKIDRIRHGMQTAESAAE